MRRLVGGLTLGAAYLTGWAVGSVVGIWGIIEAIIERSRHLLAREDSPGPIGERLDEGPTIIDRTAELKDLDEIREIADQRLRDRLARDVDSWRFP